MDESIRIYQLWMETKKLMQYSFIATDDLSGIYIDSKYFKLQQRYDVRYSRRYRCLCQETDEEAAERNENLSIKQGIPTTCKDCQQETFESNI